MAQTVRVALGTKEYLPIKVADALEHLTTLDGSDLRFDIFAEDDDVSPIEINSSADNEGLTALPLVDTAGYDPGFYHLYISFVASPETVRLGPFRFLVD